MEPREIGDAQARDEGVAPGWWGVDEGGRPALGPYPSREAVLVAMADRGFGEEAGGEPPHRLR